MTATRIVLLGHLHRIVQRGNNRQSIFAESRDYERCLETLCEFKCEFAIAGIGGSI